MLTEEQLEYFALVTFMRGVMAERMGLVGKIEGFLPSVDMHILEQMLLFLEQLEEWLMYLIEPEH